ncbi:uncharacterized protein LOC129924032 [Biomphalaria glabrata]|uniref:Uncharacterized protein LOC129924032 n=1 Tax=Biomphalaria glabrata TaxID=6526 RepID=A0A9W2ZF83_BIOGL|nr:uncharacterized protein LOC129924032 [Biomphalaria glabrata]
MVEGRIGIRKYRFLIDTGASRSVIRPNVANSNNTTNVSLFSLKTASGELMPIKGLADLEFELGCQSFGHEFLIANITDDCILGIDFLQKFGFSINISGGTLLYGNVEVSLLGDSEEGNNRMMKILLTEDTNLPAQSESIIWGKLENGHEKSGTALIEGTEDNYDGVAVVKTLVMIGKDHQRVPVRIMNLGLREKHLRRDSYIAKCHTIDLIKNCNINNVSFTPTESINPQITRLLTETKGNLSEEQYSKAKELIMKFADIFPSDDSECGRTDMSGYWQVGMHPEDKEKTAFSAGNGLWQFTVMPFGLCNAPATFERLMERVLQRLHWNTCLV